MNVHQSGVAFLHLSRAWHLDAHNGRMQIWQLLSAVHASIDGSMAPSQWASVLLPPIHVCQAAPPSAHGGSPQAASPAASSSASPDALPSAFAVHRAAAAADSARAKQLAQQDHNAAEILSAVGGCAFPAYFEPSGLGPVEASVVAELVLEVRMLDWLGLGTQNTLCM